MTSIERRITSLETQVEDGDHEYNGVIKWGMTDHPEAHYYRDGIEIPQGEFFREAPKDMELKVNWGDYIPPGEVKHDQ